MPSRRAGLGALLVALLLGTPAASYADTAEEERWRAHPSESLYYTEQWSFSFWAAEGTYVHVQFLSSNLGLRHQSAVKLEISDAAGATLSKKEKTDEHIEATGDTARLRFGENSLQADKAGLRLRVHVADITLDLTANDQVPPFKPGAPLVGTKDGLYDLVVAPDLGFRATLARQGASRELSGRGMADHSWTTLAPQKLAKHWFKIKLVDEDVTCLMTSFARPGSKRAADVAWLWWRAGGETFVARDVEVRFLDEKPDADAPDYRLPGRIRVAGHASGREWTAELVIDSVARKKDILAELGFLERMAVRAVSRPMDYTLNAQGAYHLSGPDGTKEWKRTQHVVLSFVNP